MAQNSILQNGIGGSTGAALALAKPLCLLGGRVWYVSSITGNSNYTGKDRNNPLATVQQAVTAIGASDDAIIVCLDGHAEEISSTLTLAQRVTIVGEGSSAGVPTVKLTQATTTTAMIAVTAAGCHITNIRLQPPGKRSSPAACSGSIMTVAAAGLRLSGIYLDMDRYCDAPGLAINSGTSYLELVNCAFTSTETDTTYTNKPRSAIKVNAAVTDLYMEGCILDGGTVGFDDGSGNTWAFDGSAAAITPIRCTGLSLLRGSGIKLHTSTVGYISAPVNTGHAEIET